MTYAELPLIAVDTKTRLGLAGKLKPTAEYDGDRQAGEFGSDGQFRYYDYEEANRQSRVWAQKYRKAKHDDPRKA